MAGQQDFLIKVKLEADAKRLEAELRKVQGQLNKFGDEGAKSARKVQQGFQSFASEASNVVSIFTGDKLSGATSQITAFGNALGAIPGPAGLAIGAVAGLGAVTAAGVAGLFALSKNASDFGSTIHDASIKTGIGAETISALKLAADESGSSLETMTGGIAKFAKNVAKAGEDSKESAKFVKAFGITPQAALKDLDGSLAKVFTRIGEARPGVEQITLAQKAFGKSGADLIPLMEQVGFNLDEFRKKAKELGITIDDGAAAQADAFGDQLVELEAQLAGVGRTIGFELMPIFEDMTTSMSEWLASNQGEIQSWGRTVGDVLRGVIGYWNDAAKAIREFKAESRAGGQSPFGLSAGDLLLGVPGAIVSSIAGSLSSRGAADRGDGPYGPFSWEMSKPKPGDFGGDKGGKSAKDKIKDTIAEITKAMSNPTVLAFFSALSTIEGGGINTVVGGARSSTTDPRHPGSYGMGTKGPAGFSTAAGLFQETLSNWQRLSGTLNLDDFRDPKQQLKLALFLFQEASGGRGLKSLLSGDIEAAARAGTQPWAASPFSSLPGRKRRDFLGLVNQNLASGRFGDIVADPEKKSQAEIKAAEASAKRLIEVGRSTTEQLIDYFNREFEAFSKANDYGGAMQAARQAYGLKKKLIQDEIDALSQRYQRAAIGSEEEAEAFHALELAKLRQQKSDNDAEDELDHKRETLHQRELTRIERRMKLYHDKMVRLAADEAALFNAGEAFGSQDIRGIGSFGKPDTRSEFDKLLEGVNGNKLQTAGIEAARDAFQGLGAAVGQTVEALVLYGSAGGSAQEVTARIIASVAQQAAVKAIFELAEGFAALARGIFGMPNAHAEAVMHFKSAATYGIVAGIAAGIGRGVAGDSLKQGGAGGANGGGRGGQEVNQNPDPYSRVSADAYLSGRRTDPALLKTLDNIDRTMAQFKVAKAKDVLMAGIKQSPGAIGNANVNDMKRNAGIGRAQRQVSGSG